MLVKINLQNYKQKKKNKKFALIENKVRFILFRCCILFLSLHCTQI